MMALCGGAVFMAAVFLFFWQGFVRLAALVFLRPFFILYFFGWFPVGLFKWIQNFPAVFLPFVVNENQLFTSCCHCWPATPPAPLACWVRAGMACPDLKVQRSGTARGKPWSPQHNVAAFCVVRHSEAISRAFTQKATHRAVPVQQDNSRGRIGSRRFFKASVQG